MTRNYTFRVIESGDGYKATEPRADSDTWGRGQTPGEAIQHYCEVVGDE